MSEALNLFTSSYLKRLKRPELFNYNPDQAFGANMVHRSEEQNPWANRNQDNAKFGNLGGSNYKITEGPQAFAGDQIDPALDGKTFTLPNLGSNPNSAIADISSVLARSAGSHLVDKGIGAASDWLTKSPASGLVGYGTEGIGHVSEAIPGFEGAEASGEAVAGGVPLVGTAMSLLKDLLTKKLLTDTTESVGKAGGMAGGAALGSMLFPGVGTVLGGMLGGMGGGTLGKLLKKLF